METKPTLTAKLFKTFQVNRDQLQFGTYAAELSFYIIWALIPIMLALANVIAVLPISQQEILAAMQSALPSEVESVLIPLLESYLGNTSSGVFSVGLIISLWPASKVFNTVQRVINTIYKAKPRKNVFLARGFAYLFTFLIVLVVTGLMFLFVFGETIIQVIQEMFNVEFYFLSLFVQQGWILGIVVLFALLACMYHFIPNVNWKFKYTLPGTIFAMVGFLLVSQLFTVYLALTGNEANSNSTIGVLIVLIIWLYFNAMVLAIGAYVNVFYHDFKEKSYWRLVEETTEHQSFQSYSDNFQHYSENMPGLKHQINKVFPAPSQSLEQERK